MFSFSLNFGNRADVIGYGCRRRLRFLINGKLNSCIDYSCWHGINRRHDNLLAPICQQPIYVL
jgi:hypothetical protein